MSSNQSGCSDIVLDYYKSRFIKMLLEGAIELVRLGSFADFALLFDFYLKVERDDDCVRRLMASEKVLMSCRLGTPLNLKINGVQIPSISNASLTSLDVEDLCTWLTETIYLSEYRSDRLRFHTSHSSYLIEVRKSVRDFRESDPDAYDVLLGKFNISEIAQAVRSE